LQEVEVSSFYRQITHEGRNDVNPTDGLPLDPGVIPGTHLFMGQDSSVGIATRYGPGGPVIGYRWE
jgi:hypothetical protein